MKKLLFLLPLLAATSVIAQDVQDCDGWDSARNIAEPWEENTQTFSNGDVRLAVLDMAEPAAGPLYMMVLSPPFDEQGQPQCKVISRGEGVGWVQMVFADLRAGYDPATGLTVTVPGLLYDPEFEFSNAVELSITVNQATGAISAHEAVGRH
ncbi:hypothetical protein ACJ5NV_11380 [Loktanella agnita]|uniref:hypothetical protein n=1 Tax=Loktanella agnita TaxID=287097 RepID=UPI00398572D8